MLNRRKEGFYFNAKLCLIILIPLMGHSYFCYKCIHYLLHSYLRYLSLFDPDAYRWTLDFLYNSLVQFFYYFCYVYSFFLLLYAFFCIWNWYRYRASEHGFLDILGTIFAVCVIWLAISCLCSYIWHFLCLIGALLLYIHVLYFSIWTLAIAFLIYLFFALLMFFLFRNDRDRWDRWFHLFSFTLITTISLILLII